ncbi:MAG: alpha/beta hydrolase, partial [Bacteroidales bacterium]|nr:alpha/beta hydrolase [Bacteroidales bacterium]
PEGICSAILSSTLPGNAIWAKEQHRMIGYMPLEEQQAIAKAEATGNYSDPAYIKANEHFMELHCAGKVTEESPECLRRPKKAGAEAYLHGWGPNEYTPTGSLRDYEYTHRLNEIKVPCLIMSGSEDLCTPVVAKTMYDGIPNAKWELFAGCRHMPFVEDNDRYCEVLAAWLDAND